MKHISQIRWTNTKLRSICILLALATLACAHAGFIQVNTGGQLEAPTSGGGASWGDYDGDGDVDLFVTLRPDGFNILYRNLGGGQFDRPGAVEIGDLAADSFVAVQGVWADIDNDGDIDLYVAKRRTVSGGPFTNDHIYRNDGHGSFVRQEVLGTSDANLLPNGASMADFDNDGDLDLLEPTYKGSEGLPEAFFRNDGNGIFSRLAIQNAPLTIYANNAAWADFDGDGDLDVFVANNPNDGSPAYIFKNRLSESGSAGFEAITGGPEARGIHLETSGAALWGDLDNDGDLDLVTTHNSQSWRVHRRNEAGQYNSEPYFASAGLNIIDAALIDVENDGDLDLIVGVITGGSSVFRLMVNAGDGKTFTEGVFASSQPSDWPSPAVGDFNNDGYSDVFAVYSGGAPCALFQNEGGGNHWLKLNLKGTTSNSSAVGAIVRVKANIGGKEVWQMRQVSAGGEAYRVQHDIRPNFGLGDATIADVVRIEWPSGTVQELTNVAADQILQVTEPPRLSIESAVILSWPASADGYILTGASSLSGPWVEIDAEVVVINGQATVTLKAADRMQFYQLQKP